ncbi:MAG: CHAD domain-containing protein [Planctomycetota bacterium]|nr:MAG: CHAD domain-containing protein [Planctomycetota bacterium]
MSAPTSASPTKKLLLPPAPSTRDALARAYASVLAYAGAEAHRAASAPIEAVHRFRKSVRRARALLAFSRPFLPGKERRAQAQALRAAVRETSILRDVDVLSEHSALLGEGAAEAAAREALLAHLRSRRAEQHAGVVGEVLARAAALLEPLPARYADALPDPLPRCALQRGLAAVYRRARAAHRAAESAADFAVALHRFRKRVKEVRYSLELLRSRSRSPEPLERLVDLAEALGALTDRCALADYIRAHPSAFDPEAVAPLTRRLADEVDRGGRNLLDRVAWIFAARPRAFAAAVIDARCVGPSSPSLAEAAEGL